MTTIRSRFRRMPILAALCAMPFAASGCGDKDGADGASQAMALAALKLRTGSALVVQEYPARIEGTVNVEIRPQVDGILEKIYVDEGSLVKAGQPLFRIDSRLYREQLNQAVAAQHAAEAAAAIARIEVDKLTPLVQNNVVSDIQLKAAKASLQAAKANVEQARAAAQSARINFGYTVISAPTGGYIGTIPFRTPISCSFAVSMPVRLSKRRSEAFRRLRCCLPMEVPTEKKAHLKWLAASSTNRRQLLPSGRFFPMKTVFSEQEIRGGSGLKAASKEYCWFLRRQPWRCRTRFSFSGSTKKARFGARLLRSAAKAGTAI